MNTVDVSTHGNLNFSSNTNFGNTAFPNTTARIAPLWDDFYPRSDGSVIEKVSPGVYYSVTWNNVSNYSTDSIHQTTQAVWFGSTMTKNGFSFGANDIAFSYNGPIGAFETYGGYDGATVGLNSGNGSTFVALPGDADGLIFDSQSNLLPTSANSLILFRPDGLNSYVSSVVTLAPNVTTLSSGTLLVNGATPISSGSINVDGGTLSLNGGVLETGYISEGSGSGTIHFNGGILRATGNQANFLRNFEAGDVQIGANGAFFDTQAFDVGITQVLQGVGGLTKQGTGTLTLSGAQQYAGGTHVEAGTLIINGDHSAATGAVTVASGATLGGSGTIGGATTILGIHDIGNSPGVQTFVNDLTYGNGLGQESPAVHWELFSNTADPGLRGDAALGWDGVDVGGNLTFADPTTLNLDFSGGTVDWTDGFWATDQSWLLYDVDGDVHDIGNLALSMIDFSTLQDGYGNFFGNFWSGGFDIGHQAGSGEIYLTYTALGTAAIPEPSSALILLGGLTTLLLGRRRRQLGEEEARS